MPFSLQRIFDTSYAALLKPSNLNLLQKWQARCVFIASIPVQPSAVVIEDKERTCDSLLMCIITVLSHGLRSGGGVGDVLRKPSKEVRNTTQQKMKGRKKQSLVCSDWGCRKSLALQDPRPQKGSAEVGETFLLCSVSAHLRFTDSELLSEQPQLTAQLYETTVTFFWKWLRGCEFRSFDPFLIP